MLTENCFKIINGILYASLVITHWSSYLCAGLFISAHWMGLSRRFDVWSFWVVWNTAIELLRNTVLVVVAYFNALQTAEKMLTNTHFLGNLPLYHNAQGYHSVWTIMICLEHMHTSVHVRRACTIWA